MTTPQEKKHIIAEAYNLMRDFGRFEKERVKASIEPRTENLKHLKHISRLFIIKQYLHRILSRFNSEKGRLSAFKLAKDYFFLYYGIRGITTYHIDKPAPQTEPRVILIPRYNDHTSTYAATLYDHPHIIPVSDRQMQFRFSPESKQSNMAHTLKKIGYPDDPLSDIIPLIKSLHSKGHSLFVFANNGFFTPSNRQTTLYMPEALQELLELDNLYLARFGSFDKLYKSNHLTPEIAHIKLAHFQTILTDLELTDTTSPEVRYAVISKFFGASGFRVV